MTERITVHQRDGCCSLSPSCCPVLGSDHFLCHFSLPVQGQHCGLASGPAGTFPVVRDWEPKLIAARTELDSWAAALRESCTEQVVRLPQRRAKVSALFDDMLRTLWDTARLMHPRPPTMHRRRHRDGGTGECFQALVARECGVERLPQIKPPSRLCSFLLLSALLPPACPFHPSQLLENLGKTTLRGCAFRTHKRVPVASDLRPAAPHLMTP